METNLHKLRRELRAEREAELHAPSSWHDTRWYVGKLPVGIGQHRDSDPIDVANFKAARSILEDAGIETYVSSCSSWLVGWTEGLWVPATIKATAAVRELRERLDGYPILDEELVTEEEEEHGGRCGNCGSLGHHDCSECTGELATYEPNAQTACGGDVDCYLCGDARGDHTTTCPNCGRTIKARDFADPAETYCDYCPEDV